MYKIIHEKPIHCTLFILFYKLHLANFISKQLIFGQSVSLQSLSFFHKVRYFLIFIISNPFILLHLWDITVGVYGEVNLV